MIKEYSASHPPHAEIAGDLMKTPLMGHTTPVTSDTYVIPSYLPVPGLGILPVNAFLIRAAQPLLIDTGLAALDTAFIQQLNQWIDPVDLKWIWLTHTDPDHLGNLSTLLKLAPNARIITTFLGMGKLGLLQFPLDRVYLLNPGQSLDLGDRSLLAIKPPCFDAPETTGLFDPTTRTLFSADCFGALLQDPAETAMEIAPNTLREGLVTWSLVDAPWLSIVDAHAFERAIAPLQALQAEWVLSSHLPPAAGMTNQLLTNLRVARLAKPMDGPDQLTLDQMLAGAATHSPIHPPTHSTVIYSSIAQNCY
jgi:glyoxylase-like metal-dependent hydrolase (beta-lactamase superfamily II)